MESKRVYGVYTITCTATGRVYFGESSDVRSRLSRHRSMLRHGRHHVSEMQADWDEHGRSAFEFRTVVAGPAMQDRAMRLEVEEALLAKAAASGALVYNLGLDRSADYRRAMSEGQRERWAVTDITPEMRERYAANGRLGKGHTKSPEHRAKISAAQRRTWAARDPEEVRAQMAAMGRGNLGKSKSAETRQRMSAARQGKRATEETRRRLSQSHMGNHNRAKISEDVARQIKQRAEAGEGVPELVAQFKDQGATYTIVRNIKLGKTWRDI